MSNKQHAGKSKRGGGVFHKPLNGAAIDGQVYQQAINSYKSLAAQMDTRLQESQEKFKADLRLLLAEVPGLRDRLVVTEDGYEILEPDDGA
jgi:hypothetical protein